MRRSYYIRRRRLRSVLLLLLLVLALWLLRRFTHQPVYYQAEDFGIETLHSSVDFNGNGIDDYTDFLLGARKDAKNHPTYDGTYQAGGYPPDNIGVCADVIWRAFKHAGYCLKDMVDADVSARPSAYPNVTVRDANIDFRRVKNLLVFFDTYGVPLTTDLSQIDQWQPGDIVIFSKDKHIGMVSDRRSAEGRPYIIHNSGQPHREEDYTIKDPPTAHYRFDAALVPDALLIPWHDD